MIAEIHKLARLRAALRKVQRETEIAASGVGLTPQQHQLLLCVAGIDHGRGLPIFRIAEALQLRHHSVVELVNRAVREGYVVKRRDRKNPRCVVVKIAPAGMQKLRSLVEAHRLELVLLRALTVRRQRRQAKGSVRVRNATPGKA